MMNHIVDEDEFSDHEESGTISDQVELALEPGSASPHSEYEDEQDYDNKTSIHTVTFKCIGCVQDPSHQKALKIAGNLIRDNDCEVPVHLLPEQDNVYDSKAIAIECNLDEQ